MKATYIILLIILLSACTDNERYARALTPNLPCSGDCSSVVDSLLSSNSLAKFFVTEVLPSDTVIQFGDYVGYQENSTILFKDNYEAKSGSYLIRIGSDDGFRLFVNNKLVGQNLNKRGLHPDTDWIVVELLSGTNELIFQVDQYNGSWGLHYNIEPYDEEKLKKLILKYIPEIYSDLPEACILPDSSYSLTLEMDLRIKYDQFHALRYRWLDLVNNFSSDWTLYTANAFPGRVSLPESFDGFKVFDYELINQEGEILYKESVPIFSNTMAHQKVLDFKTMLQKEQNVAHLENLSLHHPELFEKEKELEYSTRHKAEFLLDLLLLENEELSFTGGPRTELFNGKIFRAYTPYINSKPKDLIIGFHVELEDTVNQYFKTYAGKSHAKMAEWNSYVQASGNTLIMPFIKPSDLDLGISVFNNNYLSSIDLEEQKKIKAISWSKGVPILLNELTKQNFPFNEVYMISSWLMVSEQEAFRTANLIRSKNSRTKFTFWHGRMDTNVPYSYIKSWSEIFQSQNVKSSLIVEVNSTHWSFWKRPEKKIFISNQVKTEGHEI
ncbi:MAG: hypothetical protein RLN90_01010 [Balneolaceae bacterium]